jgi:hypothetical protein
MACMSCMVQIKMFNHTRHLRHTGKPNCQWQFLCEVEIKKE